VRLGDDLLVKDNSRKARLECVSAAFVSPFCNSSIASVINILTDSSIWAVKLKQLAQRLTSDHSNAIIILNSGII
jgi:tryptophanase